MWSLDRAHRVLCACADRYTYRRFLRARQHDVKRATEMWLAHIAWRREMGADTILDDFRFPERDSFISLYPQGYCNVDKMVCACSTHITSHLPGCGLHATLELQCQDGQFLLLSISC